MGKRLSQSRAEGYAKSRGYKLLELYMKNNRSWLKLECKEGHIYDVVWYNFVNGNNCNDCNRKVSDKIINETVKKYNYTLIKRFLKNRRTWITVKCDQGHTYDVRWTSFNNNHKCRTCFNEQKQQVSIKLIKTTVKERGYKFIKRFMKKSYSHITVECVKGHTYDVRWDHFNNDINCRKCTINAFKNGYSKIANDLFDKINPLIKVDDIYYENNKNGEYTVWTNKFKHRSKAYRKLDFYIPSLNKCIEFQGYYWHKGTEFEDYKRELEIKEILPNIDILYVDEMDYRNNPDKVVKQCLEFFKMKKSDFIPHKLEDMVKDVVYKPYIPLQIIPKLTVVVSDKKYKDLLMKILKLSPAKCEVRNINSLEYPTGDRVIFIEPPVCCKLCGFSVDKLITVNYKLTDEEYKSIYPTISYRGGTIEEITI
jgi:hypothetical protein